MFGPATVTVFVFSTVLVFVTETVYFFSAAVSQAFFFLPLSFLHAFSAFASFSPRVSFVVFFFVLCLAFAFALAATAPPPDDVAAAATLPATDETPNTIAKPTTHAVNRRRWIFMPCSSHIPVLRAGSPAEESRGESPAVSRKL